MTDVNTTFKLGIDVLLTDHQDWLQGQRVGLVSHTAAIDHASLTSAEKLRRNPGVQLSALFGPEHGFRGLAAAGDSTPDESHSEWGIPIYSLYGNTRKPTPEMLEGIDILIVEFQDLGARPYTYVSTLALVLEAANENHIPVIIADRPIPLPLSLDGPVTEPKFKSFVAALPLPMQYGMTPAETAIWIQHQSLPDLDLPGPPGSPPPLAFSHGNPPACLPAPYSGKRSPHWTMARAQIPLFNFSARLGLNAGGWWTASLPVASLESGLSPPIIAPSPVYTEERR